MRTAAGLIATDITDDVTTLARLMKVTRPSDGLVVRMTDHDENLSLTGENTLASQSFELAPSPAGPAKAVGVLTLTGNALTGETVGIGGRVYTFTNAAFSATGQVKVGVSISLTLQALVDAVMAYASGAGVTYSTGTTTNPLVSAQVTNITLPEPDYSAVISVTAASAFFSNASSNSGAWHDGDRQANHPNQPRTTDQTQGMWMGFSFAAPKRITHAIIYPARMSHTVHTQDYVVSWHWGGDGWLSAKKAQAIMERDGWSF